MPFLYQDHSGYAKINAQRNLQGRTHYVDDDTLRCFRSRIDYAGHHAGGLLFAIVTRDSLDHEHKTRGSRYVIFDLFGTVIERTKMEEAFRTNAQARKAMYAALDKLDTEAITREGIEQANRHHAREMEQIQADLARLKAGGKL